MLIISDAWKTTYPGAAAGILVMHHVSNPDHHPALDQAKADLEHELRTRFSTEADLKALPPIQAYTAYFKHFKKTYPVLLQLESIAFQGRSVPRVAALVEAMFVAELKNVLLTAGHDLETLHVPVRLDVARGDERYVRLNGEEQALKPGDMMMADGEGIISSVIYGPDRRTRVTPATRHVLFAVYAPPGIGEQAVAEHLRDIQFNIMLIAPEAEVELLEVYTAPAFRQQG
jgi:DNA/RNA-binding domain of Phe-tRNA-synthetase-like protein